MRTIIRRFLVVQALMLWQGGFLFYAAFVVPAGTAVLGSGAAQGPITARVTDVLNLCGAAALALLAWDLSTSADPNRTRTAARWWCWAVALVCQYALFVLHQMLDYFMDPARMVVEMRPPFYPVHRVYLWVSTVMWAVCLPLLVWTLRAWAAEGNRAPAA